MSRNITDELIKAAERIINRRLSYVERNKLVDLVNSKDGDLYNKCVLAIEEMFDVVIESQELLEKTANIDMAMSAINNLKKLTSSSAKAKK